MFETIKNIKNIFATTSIDTVVKDLVGHTNVVYYNVPDDKWNKGKYNGYKLLAQETDTKMAKAFKTAMQAVPEFDAQYEFIAPVTMTIAGEDHCLPGLRIANPQYSKTGNAIVGNIIVQNKATGKYELYGKSWIHVRWFYGPYAAAVNIAYTFAELGANHSGFRTNLGLAHTR